MDLKQQELMARFTNLLIRYGAIQRSAGYGKLPALSRAKEAENEIIEFFQKVLDDKEHPPHKITQ